MIFTDKQKTIVDRMKKKFPVIRNKYSGEIRLDEKVNTLSSPIYATGYGLLMYTIHHAKKRMEKRFSDPLAKRVVSRMKSWISGLYNR